ncbi:MAG: cysteine-rich small domain-containing protein [Agathobaculum sp.]|jgi:Zn-finger protein|uniref:cysteine-rich small domain-containing protein n=1 Tax=Agathobaculum sp. TaxID=2048138 RepID=UPI003D8FEB22
MKLCEKIEWEGKHYAFFQNTQCEYFPCHATERIDEFNCLFCYCPLYTMGKNCGGNWTILENGVKDCSACIMPHRRANYGLITEKLAASKK